MAKLPRSVFRKASSEIHTICIDNMETTILKCVPIICIFMKTLQKRRISIWSLTLSDKDGKKVATSLSVVIYLCVESLMSLETVSLGKLRNWSH